MSPTSPRFRGKLALYLATTRERIEAAAFSLLVEGQQIESRSLKEARSSYLDTIGLDGNETIRRS